MRGAASADQSNSWSTQFALKAGDEGAIYFCSLPLSIYINVLVKEMGALISHGWMYFWKKMKKWKKSPVQSGPRGRTRGLFNGP